MKNILAIILALSVLIVGCTSPKPVRPTQPTSDFPPMPPDIKLPLRLTSVALPPLKLAPPGAAFYDDFATASSSNNWSFYQGANSFTTGRLRLTVAQNAGMYAWVKNRTWTNVSVSADIKLNTATTWAAAIGVRLNTNSGPNYQAWIYGSGKLTIEKYPSSWYEPWQEVASTTIPAPGVTTNNLKLTITNNVLTVYLNGIQRISYTDTSSPLMHGGSVDLGVWGGGAQCRAFFDNVTVYSLDAPTTNLPVLVVGLTNTMALKGQNKTLSVTATGDALIYLWQTPTGQVIGTNTYTITNVQSANSYGVIITNVLGKVSSSAYVSMGTTNILTNCISIPTKTNVTLSWCPSPFTTNNIIAGYKVYYGSGTITNWTPNIYDTNQPLCPGVILQQGTNWSRAYTNMVSTGTNLAVTVSNLVSGVTYYFAATATDTNALESDYSGEVSKTILSPPPPAPLTNVVVSIRAIGSGQIHLQSKICPNALSTVLYQTALLNPWVVAASNVVADVYGNFVYIEIPTNTMRFYKVLLQ